MLVHDMAAVKIRLYSLIETYNLTCNLHAMNNVADFVSRKFSAVASSLLTLPAVA